MAYPIVLAAALGPQVVYNGPKDLNYTFFRPGVFGCMMKHLLPENVDVCVYDLPQNDPRIVQAVPEHQRYIVESTTGTWYPTTYTASTKTLYHDAVVPGSSMLPRDMGELCTAITRVNRRFNGRTMSYLYDRRFAFQCSAAGALCFLQDRSQGPFIPAMSLYFSLTPGNMRMMASDLEFEQLLKCIRHQWVRLVQLQLHINGDFWTPAPWTTNALSVLNDVQLFGTLQRQENVLSQVAKTAGYATRRYRAHGFPFEPVHLRRYKAGGAKFDLYIEDACLSQAREQFRLSLLATMTEYMALRPVLVGPRTHGVWVERWQALCKNHGDLDTLLGVTCIDDCNCLPRPRP